MPKTHPILLCSLILATLPISSLANGQDTPPAPEALAPRPGDMPERKSEAREARKPARGELARVEFDSGQRVVGYVTVRGDVVDIEFEDGTFLSVPLDAVASIEPVQQTYSVQKELWRENKRSTHRVRYLLSPSAFALEPGEGYVSHKEFVYTSFAVGLTEHVSAYAGTFLPLYLGLIPNIVGGVKVSASLTDRFHVASGLGGMIFVSPFLGDEPLAAGLVSGTVTYGTPAMHASINAAIPLGGRNSFDLRPAFFTLSAYRQFTPWLGVISESWVMPFGEEREVELGIGATSLSVRLVGEKWNLDAGLSAFVLRERGAFEPLPFPVPVLDITRNFGGATIEATPPPSRE
jgi:hypothetical protein